jgi:hypothetical protein
MKTAFAVREVSKRESISFQWSLRPRYGIRDQEKRRQPLRFAASLGKSVMWCILASVFGGSI